MYNVIGIHVPEFGSFAPDNYLTANSKIYEHYSQQAFYSAEDRVIYILTTDKLEKVVSKISFEPKLRIKDYDFFCVTHWQTSAPTDAREWLNSRLSAIEQLREFIEKCCN